ncbi:MAG TPA: FtsX-like permease family protein [Myxococcaceae bacterium]|nr:FtsX-like permease family protein [Myxococcaceae bacterium]
MIGLIVRVAFRNLFRSRINLLIGGIIFSGTLFLVVGGALLDSLVGAMSRSIVGTVSGHVQLYSERSRDELAIWPTMGNEPDLSPLPDFEQLERSLLRLPNVKAVVPMGISGSLITSGNTVDLTLEELRGVVRQEKEQGSTPALEAKRQSLKEHVRQIVRVLQDDLSHASEMMTAEARDPESVAAVERASSEAFWQEFDRDPYGALEFLENKVAPQLPDGDLIQLRYVGTDLDGFARSFDRMEIVDGTAVPPGHRGMLLSKFTYEQFLKLKTARRLDLIQEAIETGSKIADDPTLQRYVRENRNQTREILLQLDRLDTETAVSRLRRFLGRPGGTLAELLTGFFDMDDGNFRQRYDFFYRELAPLLKLYRLKPGDTLTITAFTRSGYVKSMNVPVWGTFQFKGLEKSPLAGNISLMDIVSFRELYGYLSADKRSEIETLKQEAGAREVERSRAEEELFGTSRKVVAQATPGLIDEKDSFRGTAAELRRRDLAARVFDPADIDRGVVLNAAVILRDPSKLKSSLEEINRLSAAEHLGIRAISWQQAAGLLGQFVTVARLVLYIAVAIIFVVAMVIINNAMMMATLRRTAEVGTMRAIGAQRSFVLSMVLAETLTLGLVFGFLGAVAGVGIVSLLGRHGIRATADVMYFFFSGPRLYPHLGPGTVLGALIIVILVSALSTLYPAFLAARVPPVRAMQTDE